MKCSTTVRNLGIAAAILALNPITAVIALVMWWLHSVSYSESHPERGEHLPTVKWLPKSATDISYYKCYTFKAWEFSMNEADFRSWRAGKDFSEITEPRTIPRYSWGEFVTRTRNAQPPNQQSYDDYEKEERNHSATVAHGLYEWFIRNDGGGYHLIFDRDRQRVYFESRPR